MKYLKQFLTNGLQYVYIRFYLHNYTVDQS